MKREVFKILGVFLLCTSLFFTACKPKPCDQVNCAYGGVCDNGTCICQTGYEGTHCEVIIRDKFKGIYQVIEDGTLSGMNQYTSSIENGDVINQIRIKNLGNFFKTNDVIATVVGTDLTIAYQEYNGYGVEGTGKIIDQNPLGKHYFYDAVIDLTYKVTNLSNSDVDEFGTGGSLPSHWSKNHP